MRYLACLLPVVLVGGCVTYSPHVDPVPSSAWQAAADSPRTAEPTTPRRDPVRPAPSAQSLTREQVLVTATSRDPQEAIAELDRHPFAFPLDQENLRWFEDRVAPPEVLDYLHKRSAIDWDALARSSQPVQPAEPPVEYDEGGYPAPTPSQPSTTYVVESPQPSTVVYERTYYDPPVYGGTVYVYGGGYYGSNHSYYRGGYYRPYYRSTYRASTPVYTPGTVYRAGAPAGVYSHPSYQPYTYTPYRATTTVRTSHPSGGFHGGHSGGGHHR